MLYFIEAKFADSASLPGQLALVIPCFCLISTGIIGGSAHLLGTYERAGDPNSCPYTYTASALPTEPSSQIPYTPHYNTRTVAVAGDGVSWI